MASKAGGDLERCHTLRHPAVKARNDESRRNHHQPEQHADGLVVDGVPGSLWCNTAGDHHRERPDNRGARPIDFESRQLAEPHRGIDEKKDQYSDVHPLPLVLPVHLGQAHPSGLSQTTTAETINLKSNL
jgi:hypothetical protein